MTQPNQQPSQQSSQQSSQQPSSRQQPGGQQTDSASSASSATNTAADAPVVVVTGATGPAGIETSRRLAAAGRRVVAVGRNADALTALAAGVPGLAATEQVDLTDQAAAEALAQRLADKFGRVDALVHLIGGWRGGKGFTANSEDDWKFLSGNLIDTLRHTTLALHDQLLAAPAGRAIIVSAKAAGRPTAGGANYATAKAAAEAWQRALADSFRRKQSGRKTDPVPQTAAAVIGVITAIGDKPGFTTAAALADWVLDTLDEPDADRINGERLPLPANPPAGPPADAPPIAPAAGSPAAPADASPADAPGPAAGGGPA
ncbi:SDR family NAD(P)-dependent oxidoreductase [Nakamurella aerolata]|uniref:SDR family NAD(P)-dependent oxidoreductase n=1 Tax=Nakamurella aerolata TaxID=1656892 RepID=A0A849A472_9ACTN|nr:SDR family NAD(P)-dependent oxidoreductase [Nakamurella aerolata]